MGIIIDDSRNIGLRALSKSNASLPQKEQAAKPVSSALNPILSDARSLTAGYLSSMLSMG